MAVTVRAGVVVDPHTLARLAFPEVERWADLFASAEAYDTAAGLPAGTDWCLVSPLGLSLAVRPTGRTRGYCDTALLEGLRYHFGVCLRADGTALVVVNYDQILGGRWLALLPADEVPRG